MPARYPSGWVEFFSRHPNIILLVNAFEDILNGIIVTLHLVLVIVPDVLMALELRDLPYRTRLRDATAGTWVVCVRLSFWVLTPNHPCYSPVAWMWFRVQTLSCIDGLAGLYIKLGTKRFRRSKVIIVISPQWTLGFFSGYIFKSWSISDSHGIFQNWFNIIDVIIFRNFECFCNSN